MSFLLAFVHVIFCFCFLLQYYSIMQVRENLAMDTGGTTFSSRKTFTISRFTCVFLIAILICSIITSCLLIYNFGPCREISVQSQVCESNHVRPLIPHTGDNKSKTSIHRDTNIASGNETDNIGLRLPKTMFPLTYNIKLIPFLFEKNFTFNGDVKIVVNVTETCQNITLHAMAIKIHEQDVTVRLLNSSNVDANRNRTIITNEANTIGDDFIPIRRRYFVESKQLYIIEFNKTLVKNALYEIHIKYTGILNEYLQGFYRSSYKIGNTTR